jgi:hypothetical protein
MHTERTEKISNARQAFQWIERRRPQVGTVPCWLTIHTMEAAARIAVILLTAGLHMSSVEPRGKPKYMAAFLPITVIQPDSGASRSPPREPQSATSQAAPNQGRHAAPAGRPVKLCP